jgi:hypothetical protein
MTTKILQYFQLIIRTYPLIFKEKLFHVRKFRKYIYIYMMLISF